MEQLALDPAQREFIIGESARHCARDRFRRRGLDVIADDQLLAITLGSGGRAGSNREVAAALLRSCGGIRGLSRASVRELELVSGLGPTRATRVAAAFELGRRVLESVTHRISITSPQDVYRIVAPRLAGLSQEVFLTIGLDVRNGLLDVIEVARGTVTGVEVHPREVFRPLVRIAAAAAVVAHNHPSGDPTPSPEDIELTRRLREAGTLLGIPLIDHVVIGERSFRSVTDS